MDTATTRAVVALGNPAGRLLAEDRWVAGYRHGEELLARIERLLAAAGVPPAELGGLVVGTGPGAFTGLRVGLATVKALGHALGLPVAGVVDLERPAARRGGRRRGGPALLLLQPAGPSDRVQSRNGEPSRILAGGAEPDLRPGERLVRWTSRGARPDRRSSSARGRTRAWRPRSCSSARPASPPGSRTTWPGSCRST